MSLTHSIVQKLLGSPKFFGRDFLIEKLPSWFIKKPTENEIVQTNFGFKIKVNPLFDKNIENVIYERGVYELGTLTVLREFLKPNDTFVDVGANIGFLSLAGAHSVGENGRIHCFEPVPSTFEILQKNKELNNFSQIELHEFALGERTEEATIYAEKENRGGASIVNQHSSDGIIIQVKKLDDLALKSTVNVMKIDVEGFELDVLKGAKETIRKDRPKLIIEYSTERNNSGEKHELYQWLVELGIYRVFKLKKGKERKSELVEILSVEDLPVHDNIFCME
ncbi:MAG: FkbM family methyltransferase [Fluviicola sp.]|nr:FkbM family methyltransferase [Fluviicola sp.]